MNNYKNLCISFGKKGSHITECLVFCIKYVILVVYNDYTVIVILKTRTFSTLPDSWATPSTSPTQQTRRTGCCVLGTSSTPQPQYLTLSTSPVLTTGDTSSTTTTGLILRILRGILFTPTVSYVKLKSKVRTYM